jgi:hypothetical protein
LLGSCCPIPCISLRQIPMGILLSQNFRCCKKTFLGDRSVRLESTSEKSSYYIQLYVVHLQLYMLLLLCRVQYLHTNQVSPARRLCLWPCRDPSTGSQGSQKSRLLAGLLLKSLTRCTVGSPPPHRQSDTPPLGASPPPLRDPPGPPSGGAGPERPAHQ